MAVNRVERLVRRVAKALEKARVPYAVIGGNAVAAWVATVDEDAVRATKDVDILVRRADLPAITAALKRLGLVPVEVLGIIMFVDRKRPSPKSGVHLVLAGERVRTDQRHAAPDPSKCRRAGAGFLIVDLPQLLAMKLQAFRDLDRVHVRDLIGVGLITDALAAALPPDLRKRLRQVQESLES